MVDPATGKKIYCGIKDLDPEGEYVRGTIEEAYDENQIRWYGLHLVTKKELDEMEKQTFANEAMKEISKLREKIKDTEEQLIILYREKKHEESYELSDELEKEEKQLERLIDRTKEIVSYKSIGDNVQKLKEKVKDYTLTLKFVNPRMKEKLADELEKIQEELNYYQEANFESRYKTILKHESKEKIPKPVIVETDYNYDMYDELPDEFKEFIQLLFRLKLTIPLNTRHKKPIEEMETIADYLTKLTDQIEKRENKLNIKDPKDKQLYNLYDKAEDKSYEFTQYMMDKYKEDKDKPRLEKYIKLIKPKTEPKKESEPESNKPKKEKSPYEFYDELNTNGKKTIDQLIELKEPLPPNAGHLPYYDQSVAILEWQANCMIYELTPEETGLTQKQLDELWDNVEEMVEDEMERIEKNKDKNVKLTKPYKI